jgi:hypothetical protein
MHVTKVWSFNVKNGRAGERPPQKHRRAIYSPLTFVLSTLTPSVVDTGGGGGGVGGGANESAESVAVVVSSPTPSCTEDETTLSRRFEVFMVKSEVIM